MLKDKPFTYILLLLGITLILALYFQYDFLQRVFNDKKQRKEENCVYALESAWAEQFDTFDSIAGSEPYSDLVFTTELIKSLFDPEFGDSHQYMSAQVLGLTEDYLEVDGAVFKGMESRVLQVMSDFHPGLHFRMATGSSGEIEKLVLGNNLVVGLNQGLFAFSFQRLDAYVLSQMLGALLSSIGFLVLMLFCALWLIRNYFKEKRALKYKNEFINNLTHEFRTPLTISGLALEKLRMSASIPETGKYLDILEFEQQKMADLSKRILGLAELRKTTMDLESVRVQDLVKKSIRRFELVLAPNDKVGLKLVNSDMVLHADPVQCTELLDNLLSNAIKYSDDPRRISVVSQEEYGHWSLSIEDNVIGIPK